MTNIFRLFLILVMLFTSSCAMIFNKKDVEVGFRSIPEGADVYIDGEKIGQTPVSVRLVPIGSHTILYSKDGYANREFKIKKVSGNSTLRPKFEYSMCVLDAAGSILILPMISVFSTYCAQFDSVNYSKALDKGNRLNVLNQKAE